MNKKKSEDDILNLPYVKFGKELRSMMCKDCKQNFYYDKQNYKEFLAGNEDLHICTSCGGQIVDMKTKVSNYDI